MTLDLSLMPFRLYYMGLLFIITFLALQLAWRFGIDGWNHRKEFGGRMNIALAIVFLALGGSFLFKIIHLFFTDIQFLYERYIYLTAAAGMVIALIIIERDVRKNYVFTPLAGLAMFLFLIISPTSPWIYLPMAITAIIMIFPVLFIIHLYQITGGVIRRRILSLMISLVILYGGVTLNLERTQLLIDSEAMLIVGVILIGLGMLGIFYSFLNVNLFIESDIEHTLEDLYIIDKTTMKPLFYLNISKHIELLSNDNQELFSGGIIGIESLFQTMSHAESNEGIYLIEQQGNYVYFEHGESILVVLIATEKLHSLRHYIRKIRSYWEQRYGTEKIDYENRYDVTNQIIREWIFKTLNIKRTY
jgi:hypothetical protein